MGKSRYKFKLKDVKEDECCHDVGAKACTIEIMSGRTFTYPEKFYGVCLKCGQSFEYIKDQKGKLEEVEEE